MPLRLPTPSQMTAIAARTHKAFNAPLVTSQALELETEKLTQQSNFWKLQVAKFGVVQNFYNAVTAKHKTKISREGVNQALIQTKVAEENTYQASWQYVAAKANTRTAQEQATQASDRAVASSKTTEIGRIQIITDLRNLQLSAGSKAVDFDHSEALANLQQRVREVVRVPDQLPAVQMVDETLH